MLPNERTTRSAVVPVPAEVEALIVSATRQLARPLVDVLKAEQINVQLVTDVDTAFEEAVLHRPNLIVVDVRDVTLAGVELCARLKGNTRTHFVPVILWTRQGAPVVDALEAGVDAIFTPEMPADERQARLWALLRSESVYRRQERKQQSQGSAIQDRRHWVGNFIHDLQSSIGALQVNFDYLAHVAGPTPPAAVEECLNDSRTVFKQIVRGLRTVIEYERFHAGRVSFREVGVSLLALAREVKEELDWHAHTARRELVLAEGDEDALVVADPEYLRQAIFNIVAFAVRQPSNQRTTIRTSSTGGVARLIVTGSGEPIPAEEREQVFEPYARKSRHAPVGHGVGLALAKVVVELHGGSLAIKDVPGTGSSFVLELKSAGSTPRFRTAG